MQDELTPEQAAMASQALQALAQGIQSGHNVSGHLSYAAPTELPEGYTFKAYHNQLFLQKNGVTLRRRPKGPPVAFKAGDEEQWKKALLYADLHNRLQLEIDEEVPKQCLSL